VLRHRHILNPQHQMPMVHHLILNRKLDIIEHRLHRLASLVNRHIRPRANHHINPNLMDNHPMVSKGHLMGNSRHRITVNNHTDNHRSLTGASPVMDSHNPNILNMFVFNTSLLF
jgi:hypothetical protein